MPIRDTLFPARARNPELPKGLKALGTELTDVTHWETNEKGEKLAVSGNVTDMDRLVYNMHDVVVNGRIAPILWNAAEKRGYYKPLREDLKPKTWKREWNLSAIDHERQVMCNEMFENGIWICQDTVRDFEERATQKVAFLRKRMADTAYDAGFRRGFDLDSDEQDIDDDQLDSDEEALNPGAYGQVRELLYDTWDLGCPPNMDAKDFYTKTGLPGTGAAVIRAHLARKDISDEQRQFLWDLKEQRFYQNKVLGTICRRHKPKHLFEKGWISRDGRIRSNWSNHVTAVARLNSRGPNKQNEFGEFKGINQAERSDRVKEQRYLIGCDLDQAHYRIIAAYWKIPYLLEACIEGKDPHGGMAKIISDGRYHSLEGWGDIPMELRDFKKPNGGPAHGVRQVAKPVGYGYAYEGSAPTIHRVLLGTEVPLIGEDGKKVYDQFGFPKTHLPYVNFSLQLVMGYVRKIQEQAPEWEQAWADMKRLYQENGGYMEDPIFFRRSGVLSGGKANEVVNYPILTAESSVMTIAEENARAAFPFEGKGPGTGMIMQVHDSIKVEWSGGEIRRRKEHPITGKLERIPSHMFGNKDFIWDKEVEHNRLRLEEAMTVTIPGWPVKMTCEARVGFTAKDVD